MDRGHAAGRAAWACLPFAAPMEIGYGMLFVIIGHDAPDSKDRRPRLRPDHLRHLAGLSRAGRIPIAGPFTDGSGSLIVVEAQSLEEVWDLVATDPYVKGGVFSRVDVKPFKQVFPET